MNKFFMSIFISFKFKEKKKKNTIHYSRSLLNDELPPTPITQKNQCQKKENEHFFQG